MAAAFAFHALSRTEDGDATSFTCANEMAKIQRAHRDDAGGTKASAISQDAPKVQRTSKKECERLTFLLDNGLRRRETNQKLFFATAEKQRSMG